MAKTKQLDEKILSMLTSRPQKRKELAKKLRISQDDYGRFRKAVRTLLDQGKVYKVKGNRYALSSKINVVVGRLDMTKSRGGYLVPDEKVADIYIPPENLANAFHGDRIVVRIESIGDKGRARGRVIKVLSRSRTKFVGTMEKGRDFNHVIPDDERVHTELFIPKAETGGAGSQQKVVAEIVDWGTEKVMPTARVIEVLGNEDQPGFDVLLIIKNYDLPLVFPEEVEKEAETIASEAKNQELTGREDLRELRTFTIDPADAKDFDDALSIERLDSGNFLVGVHIADVAHYVVEDSVIDLEARTRGTSVYLVDRVVPMLPHVLSSDLCSLRPAEDRLTMSVMMELDKRANLINYRLAESVIRSHHRMAYEEVQRLFDNDLRMKRKFTDIYEDLMLLKLLSKELTAKRQRRGSLDFDLPESRVVLNEEGYPEDIQKVVRLGSHRLIEEFMLLANTVVAEYLMKRSIPLISRVHEEPDGPKLGNLREFLQAFGINFSIKKGGTDAKVFSNILKRVEGKAEEGIVSTVILRSMKQALYSASDSGHFALALPNYTHFTSPIRRYPDLVVHRILRQAMKSKRISRDVKERLKESLPEIASSCSERERIAVNAERDSVNMKKVEFMERHLGDEFIGAVSGVKSYGFFVQLDKYFVEGLVHVNSLDDDYYLFVEERYSLIGRSRGRTFRIGDKVKIQVAKVDKEHRKIDFYLKEKI